jgi:hypothetical protein
VNYLHCLFLQTMSSSEKFTRAMLTIRSAFGTPAGWDLWSRMGSKEMEKALASGDDKKIEAALQAQFVAAWGAAAGKARSNKAKVVAKKDGSKVCGRKVAWSSLRRCFSAWCEGVCAYGCK